MWQKCEAATHWTQNKCQWDVRAVRRSIQTSNVYGLKTHHAPECLVNISPLHHHRRRRIWGTIWEKACGVATLQQEHRPTIFLNKCERDEDVDMNHLSPFIQLLLHPRTEDNPLEMLWPKQQPSSRVRRGWCLLAGNSFLAAAMHLRPVAPCLTSVAAPPGPTQCAV